MVSSQRPMANGQQRAANAALFLQAAYIQGWLKQLRDDSRLVITAAAQAQKAVDYILDRQEASDA